MPGIEPKMLLQQELVNNPIVLTAHVAYPFWCKHCQKIHWATIPESVRKAGLVGPRLAAFIALLKGGAHASITATQGILSHMGADLATGTISKTLQKVQMALDPCYTQLREFLPLQPCINIDETGHKDRGDQFWNWCFVTDAFTLFRIADNRSASVLTDMLGTECAATLGSDFYGAYRKHIKQAPVAIQFCMAHLIRELKFIAESTTKTIANYGKRLLNLLKKIFKLIHRRDELGEKSFQKRMKKLQQQFLHGAVRSQVGGDAANMVKRFKQFGQSYFTFVAHPGIEPTNNVAERAIRFCVIDRKVTQGTRGKNGRAWCERIWSTMATCAQRNIKPFDFIATAVACYFNAAPAPSLLE
jgi:transposase